MASPDKSHTQHLGHAHLWIFFYMDDRHVTLIQCNVIEAELDLRHIIGRESHLKQSHARYLGQSYTEGSSRF